MTLALSQGADYILMDEPFSGSDLFNREDFYRVMLGLLSDHETVILSTHLLEEVKTFLSRAVLLRQGRLIGDISQQEMEDEDLVTRVKQTYHYQADRVRKALSQLPDGTYISAYCCVWRDSQVSRSCLSRNVRNHWLKACPQAWCT